MTAPLLALPPVVGGLDVDLPGVGVRLRATRWPAALTSAVGEGSRPPVLLLHGLASSRRFWDLVVPHLVAAGLSVLALDQRGHGDSDRPSGPYDGVTVARDALTALDSVGISRAVVVGHSWGASAALRLAAEHGERVLATVALDGGFGSPLSAGADRAQARERLTPPRTALPPEDLVARVKQGPLAPWWNDQVAAAVLPLFGIGDDGLARARLPFEVHMAIVDAMLDDAPPSLADIACPAWLVSCESVDGDDWGRAKAQALESAGALLDRPRLQRWAGALHDVPLQWPALVAGLVQAAAAEVSS